MDKERQRRWPARGRLGQSAGECVFGTYELLERILSHLPPIELFRVARVNSCFLSILRSSSALHARCRMVLEGSQDSSIFPLSLELFEEIECRWSYPFGRQQQEMYILIRMRKSELAADRWRNKHGNWRKLLLSTERTNGVTVQIESWGQFRAALDKGCLGQYNSELRYEKDSVSLDNERGITLGDLADMAFELNDLDSDVDVKFSTYVNAKGEAIVHDWERPKLLPYRETVRTARRTWTLGPAKGNWPQNLASSHMEQGTDLSKAMSGSGRKQPLQPSVGESSCAPAVSTLRGFCEHEGVCLV